MMASFLCNAGIIGLLACSTLATARALPLLQEPRDVAGPVLETVYQFTAQHWIENMAVRHTNEIVATDAGQHAVVLVDPNGPLPAPEPKTLFHFPNNTVLTGIAELERDIFYVQGPMGNVYNFTFTPASNAVYRVDMRGYARTGVAHVAKVADVPQAKVLNGMCVLNTQDRTLLLADSVAGLVFRLDVETGNSEVVVDVPEMKPIATAKPPFGVNGVHIVDGVLYFTNTNRGHLGAIPVRRDGTPRGQAVLIANGTVPAADDFAIGEDGAFWVAENVRNSLVHLLEDGTVETIAGNVNSTELAGPVAAVFGKGECQDQLYVSTNGVFRDPATGNVTSTAGKIVKVKRVDGSQGAGGMGWS